jgi:hypothetical protein
LTATIQPALPRGQEQRRIWGRKPRQVVPNRQRRWHGNGRHAELACIDGPGHYRSRPVQRKMVCETSPFFKFLSHLNFQAGEKIK